MPKVVGEEVKKREKEQGRKSESNARMVALMYLVHSIDELKATNHIDGNIHNNNVWNLENCTIKENNEHSRNILHNGDKTLRIAVYNKNGELIGRFNNKYEASSFTNITEPSITGALVRGTLINDMRFCWEIGRIDEQIFADKECMVTYQNIF